MAPTGISSAPLINNTFVRDNPETIITQLEDTIEEGFV